jgi:hypothetical protein
MDVFELGQVVRQNVTFKNLAGVAVDPGALTVKVKSPLGVVTTYVYGTDAQVVKDSEGNYHIDLDLDGQGVWSGKWIGTGANKGSKKFNFKIDEDEFD